nr:EOG090X0A33 [Polyphemus pediculus]
MAGNQRWVPLESNPEVMNKFLASVGVPKTCQITDVYGLDPELLAMVPRPVMALLLLFPLNEKIEGYFRQLESEQKDKEITPSVYFLKQSVGNACGTIALIHAVANNLESVALPEGLLKKFLNETKDLTPDERATKLETDGGLSAAHEESALEGQTEAPSRDEKVDMHFIALVENHGSLLELDGRKSCPINHGVTTRDTFLEDAAVVCRKLMAVDPEEVHFTLVALVANDEA